eukprot:3562361-Rhodomonas_salina.1
MNVTSQLSDSLIDGTGCGEQELAAAREKVEKGERLLRQEVLHSEKEGQLRVILEEKHSNAQRLLRDQVPLASSEPRARAPSCSPRLALFRCCAVGVVCPALAL